MHSAMVSSPYVNASLMAKSKEWHVNAVVMMSPRTSGIGMTNSALSPEFDQMCSSVAKNANEISVIFTCKSA